MTATTTSATVEQSHRVAIQTKYNPNTRTISVWHYGTTGKRPKVAWNDALDTADNHANAIRYFLDLMEWSGRWVIGATPCQTGYVAVWAGDIVSTLDWGLV